MKWAEQNNTKFYVENLKKKFDLEGLAVSGRIIFKRIFKFWGCRLEWPFLGKSPKIGFSEQCKNLFLKKQVSDCQILKNIVTIQV
jgi:hypothetical protein